MLLFLICISFGPFITNEGNIYEPNKQINSKNIKSIKPGWHHIEITNNSIISEYPEIFSSQSIASPKWFTAYLNDEQIQKLSFSNKTNLYPIQKSFKENIKLTGFNRFLIRCSPLFVKQIDYSIFTEVKHVSYDLYALTTSHSNKEKAIELLINSPEILSFSELPKVKSLNRWAKGFVQNGDDSVDFNGQTYAGKNSLNKLGYLGVNQVATIEDSGVDCSLRYFKDHSNSVPINTVNKNHRKIIKYKTLSTSDTTDYSGHGTHCAGSICGEDIDNNDYFSAYNGGAPKAKLYVVDLENGQGEMTIDSDFSGTIEDMKSFDSFVSSNSWGLENDAAQVKYMYDVATYTNPSILWVFAAGNSFGCGTVLLPASCKNILTVGAINRLYNFNLENPANTQFNLITENGYSVIKPTILFVSSAYEKLMKSSNAIDAYNKLVVDYDSSATSYSDNAVYVTNCDQATDAQKKGCRLLLTPTSFQCSNIVNSIGVVIENSVPYDLQILGKRVSIMPVVTGASKPTPSIASFSSRGPSTYGSIKPEVVAPGYEILSASRARDNEVLKMSGTSMACPTTAGEMIILREYIVKKFGITNPTSNLLRAFAICGAVKNSNPSLPDNEWGFGMLNIGNTVEEISGNKVFVQNEVSIKFGKTLSFDLVVVDKSKPVSIAMSYIDLPASAETLIALVVDLDLFVVSPSGTVLHPIGSSEDQYSTVERIYIEKKNVEVGTYKVYIKSSQPKSSSQLSSIPLSIVAIGSISSFTPSASSSHLLADSNAPWTDVCSSKSVAIQDGCKCYDGNTGLFCQHEVINFPTENEQVYTIPPMETLYLKGILKGMNKNFNLNMYQQTTPFCYIKVHTNADSLPDKINGYTYTNTFNQTMMSITGYPSSGFSSNQPIYFAITNFGSFKAVLQTSLTIDKDPKYAEPDGPPIDRGISYGIIISVAIVCIFAIIILIIIVICCINRRAKRSTIRRRTNTSTSNSNRNNNNNNTTTNNNNNGGAANISVPTEVESNYVAPSYPSGVTNTYPYPYPQAGYPPQNPPGVAGNPAVVTPVNAYQPSPPPQTVTTTTTNDEFPVVDPQPVNDKTKINTNGSNQGIPTVNPYDPANFPSVNANNNANRVSYYPPYANPDDDK